MACPYLNDKCQRLEELCASFYWLHFDHHNSADLTSGITGSPDEVVIEKTCKVDGEFKKCQEYQRRQDRQSLFL